MSMHLRSKPLTLLAATALAVAALGTPAAQAGIHIPAGPAAQAADTPPGPNADAADFPPGPGAQASIMAI